ncbi:MAG: archease [Acidobacteriota bacterium]
MKRLRLKDVFHVFQVLERGFSARVEDTAVARGMASAAEMGPVIRGSWEHFPHQADIGVRGTGASKEEAFEQAALALSAITTDPVTVSPREEIRIACEAPDDELLLVDWLNAIVFEMSSRRMVFGRFDVRFAGKRLQGAAWGEELEETKHRPAVEAKGATYTELRVRQDMERKWVAQCVVDV